MPERHFNVNEARDTDFTSTIPTKTLHEYNGNDSDDYSNAYYNKNDERIDNYSSVDPLQMNRKVPRHNAGRKWRGLRALSTNLIDGQELLRSKS